MQILDNHKEKNPRKMQFVLGSYNATLLISYVQSKQAKAANTKERRDAASQCTKYPLKRSNMYQLQYYKVYSLVSHLKPDK